MLLDFPVISNPKCFSGGDFKAFCGHGWTLLLLVFEVGKGVM